MPKYAAYERAASWLRALLMRWSEPEAALATRSLSHQFSARWSGRTCIGEER